VNRIPTAEQRGRDMLRANGYGPNPESADPGYVPRKVRRGGHVKGKHPGKRPDRRARGGAVPKDHPDEPEDAAMIRSALRQHENAEHDGEHHALKFAEGGGVPHARGKKPSVVVNVKTGGGKAEKMQAAQQGIRTGMALGARQAAAGMNRPPMPPPAAPRPPMAAPVGAGAPMPGGPPRPPMGPPPMPGGGAPQMVRHGGAIHRDGRGRFTGGAV
jgi:hypothetical protein